MTTLIALTPEQEAWLEARVAIGDFTSIEEGAHRLVDDQITVLVFDAADDMA